MKILVFFIVFLIITILIPFLFWYHKLRKENFDKTSKPFFQTLQIQAKVSLFAGLLLLIFLTICYLLAINSL